MPGVSDTVRMAVVVTVSCCEQACVVFLALQLLHKQAAPLGSSLPALSPLLWVA